MSLDPNAAQRAASDPKTSAFVSASAGSGKTKLLTDRLLRLMLTGTPPQKILCLTYTKAAAAEMAIRLNRKLGAWVVLKQDALDAELAGLDIPATPQNRDLARRLFADVLDLPGGMKIQTIHAFCQSLLRRFPLEAGLSPHFELADDADAASRLREARDSVLGQPHARDAIAALAAETTEQDFANLTAEISAGQNDMPFLLQEYGWAGLTEMQRAALAAPAHEHDEVIRAAVSWTREPHVTAALRRVADDGNPSGKSWALNSLVWLTQDVESRALAWAEWVGCHITGGGTRRKLDRFYGKTLAAERATLRAELDAEHDRIERIEEQRKAAALCRLNAHLTALMAPILAADTAQKTAAAALGYGDLITRTSALLKDPGVAWIMYKLDGGIDHLLLDEVQDTAPAQWAIAAALADEFFAGAGASDVTRTIFAVGDPKQSIFSFQGADLASFETHRNRFREKVQRAGARWLDGKLETSFRSTAPVLALVDAVFAAGFAQDGVTPPGTAIKHLVSRIGQAGRVTLWPLTQAQAAAPPPDWAAPADYAREDSAKTILARDLAAHIRTRLDSDEVLLSRNRKLRPADFLVLVRHRDEFIPAFTRAAKDLKIPIAGADRMVLTQQPAVADLLALLDALILPEDDLAFAHFLASPLGGLTDDDLMDLALGRGSSIAAALSTKRENFPAAYGFFDALRAQADFLTPYALLAEALGPLGGRARLLARLGPEAAEPIDELLAEALTYTRREPGSLQGFLQHLRAAGQDIKREPEAAGDAVRIMTVHGAKGLQAPIVILPDTTGVPKPDKKLFWLSPPQQPDVTVPIFCPRSALRSQALADAKAAEDAKTSAEQNRLLYVALTRAEDELLIAGAAPARKLPDACWYNAVRAGFSRLDAEDVDGVLSLATPQAVPPQTETAPPKAEAAAIPAWAGAAPDWRARPPAAETRRPEPLAPSRSTDDADKRAIAASPIAAGAAGVSAGGRAAALAKGTAIHALLQHLPDLAPGDRAAAAASYLARIPALPVAAHPPIIAALLGILDNPALAPLFGPSSRAEVPLAGVVGEAEIGGLVDRIAILPDRIILADYKTDRAPPADLAAVPAAYLRQLAAYTAILAQIFPGRPITCLLIFTELPDIIELPPDLLVRHAPA